MYKRAGRMLVMAACALLAACGGGGGGGESRGSAGVVTVRFVTAPLELDVLEGETASARFSGEIVNTSSHAVYIGLEESGDLVDDVIDTYVAGSTLGGELVLKNMAVGVHETELILHACTDETCHSDAATPARLPVRLTVRPNIAFTGNTTLERTGREPAPRTALALSVPAEAGPVELQVDANPGAFAFALEAGELRVSTEQWRAGTYRATATVYSPGNPRYRKSVELVYTVTPPPGGEVPLSITFNGSQHLSLAQGEVVTQRLKVTRPSWTDALDAPVIDRPDQGFSLTSVGNDEYELRADAGNKAPGLYFTQMRITAGQWGGGTDFFASMDVDAPLSLPTGLSTRLTLDSTLADLRLSSPVVARDGAAVRWTATTAVPWIRLVNASGLTGVDALSVDVDRSALPKLPFQAEAEITITLDRPGTLPFKTAAIVVNEIPRLDAAGTKVMVGPSGTVYIEGSITSYSPPASWSALRVQGAQMAQASVVADTRFLGMVALLKFDFTGAVPGRDITVAIDFPLMPSQVTISVEAPVTVPAGYVSLPYGDYRPPRYAAGMDSLYFASPGRAHRWSHAGGTWQLTRQDVAGLIDLAPSPDERQIHGVAASQVIALRPTDLGELARSDFAASDGPQVPVVDARLGATMNAFAYSADYRAFASKRYRANGVDSGAVMGWLHSNPATDLMSSPGWGDPGTGWGSMQYAGIVRSPGGHTLLTALPDAPYRLYRSAQRADSAAGTLPAGVLPVAVDDAGTRVIGSDGRLYMQSSPWVDIAAWLPPDRVPSGYALSGDGRFALVYAYRIALEGGLERARDAALWVIDLKEWGAKSAQVVATLPLQDAVGCTAPLSGAETCRHAAAITVTDGFRSAFVLGPRGAAAVSLPDVGQAGAAQATRRMLRGAVKLLGPAGSRTAAH
jgi:hypothetical protein